jgi:LDH2 family malate/lactate/ureidoglycolate dehydrogenase
MLVSEPELRTFTQNIFLAMGCSEAHAALAADVLLKSDLRGIDSHGVARLSGYIRLWEKQRINATPDIKVVYETATTATRWRRRAGPGGCPFAMQVAIEKAKTYGSGWVSVRNSNHFGIAGYHALMAVEQDMIGFAMTNASPLVAPTFLQRTPAGHQPMCYAFPAGQYPPVIVDMATSAAANGKAGNCPAQRQASSRRMDPGPTGAIHNRPPRSQGRRCITPPRQRLRAWQP